MGTLEKNQDYHSASSILCWYALNSSAFRLAKAPVKTPVF